MQGVQMMSASNHQNPFAFDTVQAASQKLNNNTVDYIPPYKRKQMKEYLSNSSINLANGQEKHYSSVKHF